MLTQLSKALQSLDETNIDRYINVVVNNPNLGPYNHAYLFNQGNINKFVLPDNSIHELKKRSSGEEAEIYLPVFKEQICFARAKVKEVKPIKKSDVGINYLTGFFRVFGVTPKPTELLGNGRLGHFNKDDGEAFISRAAYESQFSDKGLINRAVLEIMAELFASDEEAKNIEYNKLIVYMVLLNQGFYPSMPELNMKELKQFLDEEKLMNLSLIIKKCQYLAEGIVLDFEEVMILRALMKEDRAETIGFLEQLEKTSEAKYMINQLKNKLLSTTEASYSDLYLLKEAKKLQLHQGFKGYFDTRKYFNILV